MPADQHYDALPTRETAGELESAGTVIGRYHLLQKIGEGGMGEVWLAEQKEPVRRRVALKVVKAGMNTREVMVRFESERQALALMDHPAIAKVLDAGSTSDGAPYFVMEYVAGVPINTYCDNHRLSTRDRLELFIHVCEGVQHAHQKAIIHRDLKPSNILVTEVDGRPAPKIIDFGVAKALSQRLTADTMLTRAGAMVGTPEYMSPEQALSSGEDIDTRSDVYSLGIIFYELLAGAPPIELSKVALTEFLRRLREDDPPKPSTKVSSADPVSSFDVAHKRRTEAPTLVRQMRGDLDAIALKALEKDRSRRYGSPSEFGADIGRYLRNEAVLAVPPSVVYRARKLARRHRAAFVTATAFVLVLTAAAVISTWEAVRTRRAEAKAKQESAVAQAVNDFLQKDLLGQASPYYQTKPDPNITVRTVLERAAQNINGKFDKQPEVGAAIRDTIGQTYIDLGLYPEARAQLQQALDLQRKALGPENPATLKTVTRLARAVYLQGKDGEAGNLLTRALAVQRRILGPEHPDTLESMNDLANVYGDQGKYAEAEALYSQTLAIQRRVLGPEYPDTLTSTNRLAIVYYDEGKYAQGDALESQTLDIRRRVLGPENPDTLRSMDVLAAFYDAEGKHAQAEALGIQTLEVRRRVLGSEHPETLASMNNLASTYDGEGKYAQAQALYTQSLEIKRRVLGPEHPGTLTAMNNLANAYSNQGEYAQAETLYTRTLEVERRVLGREDPSTLYCAYDLALLYAAEGKYGEAEVLFSQTAEVQRRVLGPEHPDTLATVSGLGIAYQRRGRYAMAETCAAQALAGRRHALGSQSPDTIASEADLALAYLSQGKFAQSEPLAREALQAEEAQADNWQRYRAESVLGASLAGETKYADAEPLLLSGYQGMRAMKGRIAVPDQYHLDLAHQWVVQLYEAWGKPAKAAPWKRK